MQEGVAALGGYGRIFRRIVTLSGRVPQISIVTGLSAGGGAYSPALTDWVVMTEESSMFLTGPGVVREALGEDVTAAQLGGTKVHERNGVCHFVAPTDVDAAYLARELLGYLPAPPRRRAAARSPAPAAARPRPRARVPAEPRRVYDVRDVDPRAWSTAASCSRWPPAGRATWSPALPGIDGRTVGVVANQPRYLGGVLDADARRRAPASSPSATRSGSRCSCSSTRPGYMPGTRQESAGVIRFGAGFVHAFAEAEVPRVTVILRKAFGGAYITMNSKDLGADYVFAWPRPRSA